MENINGYDPLIKLCDMPDREFETGGLVDKWAKDAGYGSGKAWANDCYAWGLTLQDAYVELQTASQN